MKSRDRYGEKKRICIIAFKQVRETIHVIRQIEYLSRDYDLTVVGHGDDEPAWPRLTWNAIPPQSRFEKVAKLFWYACARVHPPLYERWYWRTTRHRLAFEHALASHADAFHANDWESLPIAVEAARRTGARVVAHLHEYAEEERTQSLLWRLLVSPCVRHLMRRYACAENVPIDAAITVCQPIADRYREELGLRPIVVFNAPKPAPSAGRAPALDTGRVRLIHHGYAKRGRGLGRMIEGLAAADRRYVLELMLVDDDPGYIAELRRLAERVAPGRVTFREPVAPGSIVASLTGYDLGFCVIEPSSYNNLMMLPNKLFEYVQAGLGLIVGPSPAMADLVRQYGIGVVTASYTPADVAQALDALTPEHIMRLQAASRRAATLLNADHEMGKVLAVYEQLFREPMRTSHLIEEEVASRAGGSNRQSATV